MLFYIYESWKEEKKVDEDDKGPYIKKRDCFLGMWKKIGENADSNGMSGESTGRPFRSEINIYFINFFIYIF